MTRGKRWWWWAAVAATAFVVLSIPLSFRWVTAWTDSGYRVNIYFQQGMLCGHDTTRHSGMPGNLTWYGAFWVHRSSGHVPWSVLPRYRVLAPRQWSVEVPLHLSLLVLLPVVVYPILPPVIRRNRRKRGLCGKCGYDLRGQEEPRCPECNTPFDLIRMKDGRGHASGAPGSDAQAQR